MESDLRKLQLVCLDILKEVVRVCDKYDIKYFLYEGTLLGCIRHKGFIPWDDDLDIAMLRDDYDKFLKVAEKELNDGFFLQTFDTDENYPLAFAKVRKNNTFLDELHYQNIDMNKGIFIDIFPLDNMPNLKILRFFERKILRLKYVFCLVSNKDIKLNNNKKYEGVVNFLRKFIFWNGRNKLVKFDKRIKRYNKLKNCKYCGQICSVHKSNGIFKKYWLENLEKKEFEGLEFLVPSEYNSLLSHSYGDYMKLPPIEERKPQHGINFSLDIENG